MFKIYVDVKLILKQMILHNKLIKSNPFNLFFILFFVVFSISICIVFIPISFGMPILFQIGTIIPIGIIYASISYLWRESTLYRNLLNTKNSKIGFNISILSSMFIYAMIFTIIILSLVWILNHFNLLLTSWYVYGGSEDFSILGGWYQWGIMIYTQIINVILMFSLCFLFQSFLTKIKTFYVLLLLLMIILFIFGGTLNNYFTDIKKIVPPGEEAYWVPAFSKSIFPFFLYFPSLFTPFYANGQILQASLKYFSADTYVLKTWVWLDSSTFFNGMPSSAYYDWAGPWVWNILWIMPWIQIMFFFLISIFKRKIYIH